MNEKSSLVKRFLSKVWNVVNTFRRIIVNLVFFGFLFFLFLGLGGEGEEIIVPDNAAVVLNFNGDVVEQKKEIDPVDAFIN